MMRDTGLYVRVTKDDGSVYENLDITELSDKQRLEVAIMWADFERQKRINFINALLKIIKEL